MLKLVYSDSATMVDLIGEVIFRAYEYNGRIISRIDVFNVAVARLAKRCVFNDDVEEFELFTPLQREWALIKSPFNQGSLRLKHCSQFFDKIRRLYALVQTGEYKYLLDLDNPAKAKVRICQIINGHN